MSTYKEIRGFAIENFTTDPGNPPVGQLWYNNTTASYKYNTGNLTSSWATGNPMGSARYSLAGAGTTTATVAFGGFSSPPDTTENKTELYNGSTWTATAVMPTGQWELCGSGVQTSALAYNGNSPLELCQSWNGSSWTTGSGMNVNNATSDRYGVGISNASAFLFGGPPSSPTSSEEFYFGTWSTTNALTTNRDKIAGVGNAEAALAFGGDSGSLNLVEEWNGLNWTSKTVLNNGRNLATGSGLSTLGTAFGGITSPGAYAGLTEQWNGTTWTNMTSMSTPRQYSGGDGASAGAGIAFGGKTSNAGSSAAGQTEKFTSSGGVKIIART